MDPLCANATLRYSNFVPAICIPDWAFRAVLLCGVTGSICVTDFLLAGCKVGQGWLRSKSSRKDVPSTVSSVCVANKFLRGVASGRINIL